MKMRTIAFAAMIGCALGAGIASAQREAREQNVQQSSVTSVHAFVEKWQQRILSENLSVADPQNWATRSLPKLASFSAERLSLAMQAGSIGELEALMVSAPVANGTSLALLSATKPGNISLDAMTTRAVRKTDPTGSPASYSDLTFTAVNPCRILDSRPSQGGSGIWVNGVSKIIQIGPYSSYAFQGGSATSCGLTTLAGNGQIAAVMLAVSSFSQTGTGYLTFYSADTPDPSLSVVSMFYTAGPVQTAFVVAPTDLVIDVFSAGTSRIANTQVALDIVGYFAKPHAAVLDCVTTFVDTTGILTGATFNFAAPACPGGYGITGAGCKTPGFNQASWAINGLYVNSSGQAAIGFCAGANITGGTISVQGYSQCCRTPGR